MRLVTFQPKNSMKQKIGVLDGEAIIDVTEAYKLFLYNYKNCEWDQATRISQSLIPNDMVSYLEGGDASSEALEQAQEYAKKNKTKNQILLVNMNDVKLFSPITKPRSFRDFISFEEHIRNARKRRGLDIPPAWYDIPVYYKGSTDTIIGPEDEVVWPEYTEKLDYELELAVVIGKSGINIPIENANDYIAGYMIMNDFSARDIQAKEMSVGLGPAKGKDFATAFGPYLVTSDEVKDPYNLQMRARVNGEEWSNGNSGTIYRSFSELISYVSQSERLHVGDVLGSGTVGKGCGLELGRLLKPGDEVELEIDRLGILKNTIGSKNI